MPEYKGILGKVKKLIDKQKLKTIKEKIYTNDFKLTDKEMDILKRIIKDDVLPGRNPLSRDGNFHPLFEDNFVKMLLELSDSELTKIVLEKAKEQGHLRQAYKSGQLSNYTIGRLLKQIGDENYTKQYIDGYTQIFDTSEATKMVFISRMSENSQDRYNSYIKDRYKANEETFEQFDLPEGMTIGMEIETSGQYNTAIPTLYGWNSKYDKTITPYGAEVVSPILNGNKKDVEELYITCNILKDMGAQVNSSCGGHIHIGADYISTQGKENLIALWGNTEEVLYKICNERGDQLRGISFAEPISGKIQEKANAISLRATYHDIFKTGIGNRFLSMNFCKDDNKDTIEFRMSNSTLKPEVWIQNANLYGGMVAIAERLAQIMQKGQRTEEEQQMMNDFSTLCTEECSEEQKLDILLKLAIRPEKRYIYEDRYAANSLLIEENKVLHDYIVNGVTKRPLISREIARTMFCGQNRVKGQDMEAAEQRLIRDIERSSTKEQENGQLK